MTSYDPDELFDVHELFEKWWDVATNFAKTGGDASVVHTDFIEWTILICEFLHEKTRLNPIYVWDVARYIRAQTDDPDNHYRFIDGQCIEPIPNLREIEDAIDRIAMIRLLINKIPSWPTVWKNDYDETERGSGKRGPGRPATTNDIAEFAAEQRRQEPTKTFGDIADDWVAKTDDPRFRQKSTKQASDYVRECYRRLLDRQTG